MYKVVGISFYLKTYFLQSHLLLDQAQVVQVVPALDLQELPRRTKTSAKLWKPRSWSRTSAGGHRIMGIRRKENVLRG